MWNFEKVRTKMEEEGRTPKWLAAQIGMDVKSLRNVLRGARPSLPIVKLICIHLGLMEEDIFKTQQDEAI